MSGTTDAVEFWAGGMYDVDAAVDAGPDARPDATPTDATPTDAAPDA